MESYDIILVNACMPLTTTPPLVWVKPICPPNILTCLYPGKHSGFASCLELNEAYAAWRTDRDLIRAHAFWYQDLACTDLLPWGIELFPYYLPIMWRVSDPTDPKFGFYRFAIIYFGSSGVRSLVFAAESPTNALPVQFDNLLPDPLDEWCATFAGLQQIGTGGWVRVRRLDYSPPACNLDCRRPASLQVRLSGFDLAAPGCVELSAGGLDSADLVVVSGVDGVYEVPYDSEVFERWVYKLDIPGSVAQARFWTQPACAGVSVDFSGGVSIEVTLENDGNRTIEEAKLSTAMEPNMFRANGFCFNAALGSSGSETTLQGAGSMRVERMP